LSNTILIVANKKKFILLQRAQEQNDCQSLAFKAQFEWY